MPTENSPSPRLLDTVFVEPWVADATYNTSCYYYLVHSQPPSEYWEVLIGSAKFGKKSRFHNRTGGDNESIANFQGVPYTFDQNCSSPWPWSGNSWEQTTCSGQEAGLHYMRSWSRCQMGFLVQTVHGRLHQQPKLKTKKWISIYDHEFLSFFVLADVLKSGQFNLPMVKCTNPQRWHKNAYSHHLLCCSQSQLPLLQWQLLPATQFPAIRGP